MTIHDIKRYVVLKYVPYVQPIDELETIFNQTKAKLPKDVTLVMIPNNIEFIADEDLSYLKSFKKELEKIIEKAEIEKALRKDNK